MIIDGFDVSGWAGGTTTGGGNDPLIVNITNLNDSGPGSYRAACEDFGTTPRRGRFTVGGRINLRSDVRPKSNLTIDAIEDGKDIEITRYRTRLTKSNIFFRGLDFPIGNDANSQNADNRDAVSIGSQPDVVSNIWLVQNTLRWTGDEVSGAWGPNTRITYALNIFAEPIRDFAHTKGPHAMGVLVGARDSDPSPSKVSLLFNLFVSCDYRNPLLKDGLTECECIGNVIHNYGNSGITISGAQVDLVNNIVQRGPSSSGADRAFRNNAGANDLYVSGNRRLINGTYSTLNPDDPNRGNISTTTRRFNGPTTAFPAAGSATLNYVLANAGHNPNDDHVLRYKQHVLLGVGSIIDEPKEILDHLGQPIRDSNGGNNPTDADAYDWKIPDEFKDQPVEGPSQSPLITLTGSKGNADVSTPLVIPNVDPTKNWELRIARTNDKGQSEPSNFVVVSSNPVAGSVSGPSVVGSSTNKQWRFDDIEAIAWPAGHLAGDYRLDVFSARGIERLSGNSWATFLSDHDGVLVDEASDASRADDLHQGVGYVFASQSPEASITPRDIGATDTGNITSSAYVTIHNASSAPTQLGSSSARNSGSAITHPGGNAAVGDRVAFILSAAIGSNNQNQFTGTLTCPGVQNLTLAAFSTTTATSRAVHTYIWSGVATQAAVGPFSATANNPLDWTISSVRVPV